jgi:fibro-slime domain-containing protein
MNPWGCGYSTPGYFPLDKYSPGCSEASPGKTYDREDCMQWNYTQNGNRNNNGPTQSCIDERKHNYNFSLAGSGEFKYNKNSNDKFKFVGDDDMWIFIDGVLFEDPERGTHADLGGVHLGAPAEIDINRLAEIRKDWPGHNWADGSPHAINFFYAERGADDSNLYLEMSLSGLKPPRFGAPYIMEVTTIQSTDGTSTTTIYVNNKLDRDHFNKLIRGDEWGEKFPIIMHKAGQNDLWGFKFSEAIGEPVDAGSKGYAYTIVGTLCKTSTDCSPSYSFNSGDSLSFNIVGWEEIANGRFIDHGFVLSPNVEDDWLLIRSEAGNKANKLAWGRNTTKLPPIKFEPDVVDKDPKKPPFNIDQWFTGDPNGGPGSGGIGNVGAGDFGGGGDFPKITWIWDPKTGTMEKMEADKGKNDGTVHGFGGKGSPIPPSRAGELILTSYPNSGNEGYAEWLKNDEAQRLFGVPPKVKGPSEPFGVADPSVEQPTGGYMFVKNGFPGESSVGTVKVAPTRCVQDGDPEKPKINCLNFSLVARQPFKLAVTVYDQLGNFVTQYREEVTEQEFRSAVQAPTYLPGFTSNYSDQCREPDISKEGSANGDFGKPDMAVANGMVKVNVNVYPFAADGRRFGNGVYILKIDRVDMPYEGCVNMAGNQSFMGKESFPFVRYHADMKYGWMRSAGGSNENGNKNQDNPAAKRGRWF